MNNTGWLTSTEQQSFIHKCLATRKSVQVFIPIERELCIHIAQLISPEFDGEVEQNMQLCKGNIHFLSCSKSHRRGALECSRPRFRRGQETTCKFLFSCSTCNQGIFLVMSKYCSVAWEAVHKLGRTADLSDQPIQANAEVLYQH